MADETQSTDPNLGSELEATNEVAAEDQISAENSEAGLEFTPEQVNAILSRPAPNAALGKPPEDASGLLTNDQIKATIKEFEQQQKYGDRPIAAGAAALASGLTFSLSDRALEKSGLVSKETLRELAERNPEADIMGQVTGALLPAVVTGGATAPESAAQIGLRGVLKATAPAIAERAGLAAERVAAKAFTSAAAESGSKKLVSEIVKKSVEKGAGSAVEGGVWGTNQLLREDAIGKAELNAENLLSYAGDGALIGGGLGAALVPGGAILRGVGGGLSKGLKKAGTQVLDATRDSAKLLGIPPGQVARFVEKNPKFLENLPEWVRTKLALKWNDSEESLLAKLGKTEEQAAQSIDDAVVALDAKAAEKGQQIGPGIYDDVAKNVEDRFVAPNEGMQSMQGQSAKAKEIIEDMRAKAAEHRLSGTSPTLSEIRTIRRKMDELAKSFYKTADPATAAQAAFAARDAFKQSMVKYAEAVDPQIAQKFKDANLDYHYATTLWRHLNKKNERTKDFVNFKDLMLGAVGLEVGDAIDGDSGLGFLGIGLAGARKFMNSDLKRRMVILSQVEKGTQRVASRTEEALKNFFTKAAKPTKPASLGVLVRSDLAQKVATNERPKNKQDAYKNIQDNVVALAADPAKMQDRIAKSTSVLAAGAPQTARAMGDTMIRAVNFIARNMPKDAKDAAYNFFEPEYEPSSMEMATFERYMQVIENPLSVLKDLESGALTQDHVMALKSVYPNLYNEIRVGALKQAQSNPKLTYNKRVQLGILLDIPTDSTLSPTFVMQMQTNFVPPEQRPPDAMGASQPAQNTGQPAVRPTVTGASKLEGANRQLTASQKVATGEGS